MSWASTSRWSGKGLLDSLANTLLDLGLPRIRAWLQQRFGPEAEVARVRLEGADVILEGARLPLEGAAVLIIDEARARVGTGASKLRLLELRGRILVEATRRFTAPVEFIDEAGRPEQWVHGRLSVRDASWTSSHGEEDQAPLSGEVFARLSSESWALSEGRLTCAAAEIELRAAGTMRDGAEMPVQNARLGFTRARAGHLFDALLALAGQELELTRALPWTALLDGEAHFDAIEGLRADLRADLGEGHELGVEGKLALDGALSEVRLRGALDPRVVPLLEPWTQTFAAESELAAELEATVEGSLEAPRWTAKLRLPSVDLRALPSCPLRELVVEGQGSLSEASGRMSASGPGGLGIQAFASWDPAAGAGGAVEGRVELGGSALAVTASFDAELQIEASAEGRVELGDLAIFAPELVGDFVTPAGAALELRVEGSPTAARIEARARVDRFCVRERQIDLRDAELELSGTLGSEGFTGRLGLETGSSALALEPLRIEDGPEGARLEGSVLAGRLSSQDLQSFVLIEEPVELLPDAHVRGRLDLSGPLAAPVLDGEVSSEAIALRIPAGSKRVKVVATEAAGRIRVEPTRFIYEKIGFRWASSRLAMSGELPYSGARGEQPAARVEMIEIHPALVATVACIAAGGFVATVEGHGEAAWRVPTSLRTLGILEAHIDGAVEAQLGFETEDTTLVASVAMHEGQLRGTCSGRLATADLARIGALAHLPVALEPQGHLRVDLELGGTSAAPQVRAKIEAKTPMIRFGGECFVIDSLGVDARVDARLVQIERLHLERGGGSLDASGEWRLDRPSARAQLRWRGLEIDDLPLDPRGAKRVRAYVTGRSEGRLELHWLGRGLGGLSAQGRVELEQAAYPFLYAFESTLRRLGLPEPRIAGTTPAHVELSFDGEHLRLMKLRGAVRGCALEGEVRIARTGALDGALHATVPASYLERSPLLVLPARLTGDLRVPVSVGGTIDEPRFEPDVMATVSGIFGRGSERPGKSRVDAWLDKPMRPPDIPERLRRRKASPKAKPPSADSVKDVEARILDGEPEEGDALIRQLMERGVDLEVIDRILARRRKGRR